MHVELYCPNCRSHFAAAADLDRATEEGTWYALGDGQTCEDALAAALADDGADRCPSCGEAATVSEESLGRLTLALLGTW